MSGSEDNVLPATIESEAELIDFMTRPSGALIALAETLPDRIVVLGAGGKMGPTMCIRLARAARTAGRALEIVAVSRFSDPEAQASLEAHGITIHRADLLDADAYNALPDADLVYYLVGQKFGTTSAPHRTWSANTIVPTYTCQRYGRPGSGPCTRIVALSTGNVYGMTTPSSGGSDESDPLHPVGEYAASAVGRERVFEHFDAAGQVDALMIRLNYAIDLRYGVLVDIAQRIVANAPIDLSTGYFNCIWQGEANDVILRCAALGKDPDGSSIALNVTGDQVYSVRNTAAAIGDALGRSVRFEGAEQPTALLSNASRMTYAFGAPEVPIDRMIEWTAAWLQRGGTVWSKPTHFESRDGRY